MDLIGTTSSTSFTRPATFRKKHHSFPYKIFCASSWVLHPNVIFPWNSQVRVPRLGLSLSQNVGCSFFFQINFFLKVQGQYFITFQNIFPMVYNTLQLDLIWPLLSKGLWSGVKFSIWFLPLLLIIIHANQV
jgi:hypothetical protein